MMKASSTDRIEKTVVLKAPRARVWRALTNATEFGEWFGLKLAGEIAKGAHLRGRMQIKGKENLPDVEIWIDRLEPERVFAYRWHPFAIQEGVDFSQEPTTLVVFTLEDAGEGTHLTVVETGFDAIPESRRATAFRANTGGWEQQMERIRKYVDN
jgi:uncharacterized protein YndB with AHSA1/START domain